MFTQKNKGHERYWCNNYSQNWYHAWVGLKLRTSHWVVFVIIRKQSFTLQQYHIYLFFFSTFFLSTKIPIYSLLRERGSSEVGFDTLPNELSITCHMHLLNHNIITSSGTRGIFTYIVHSCRAYCGRFVMYGSTFEI